MRSGLSNLTSIGARERANGHALSLSALNDSMTTSPPTPPSNTKPVATTSLLPGGQDQSIKKWMIEISHKHVSQKHTGRLASLNGLTCIETENMVQNKQKKGRRSHVPSGTIFIVQRTVARIINNIDKNMNTQ
jgi:hypothetical protein